MDMNDDTKKDDTMPETPTDMPESTDGAETPEGEGQAM